MKNILLGIRSSFLSSLFGSLWLGASFAQALPSSATDPLPSANAATSPDCLVFFGTYSAPPTGGVFVSRLNLVAGTLSPPVLAGPAKSPSFLAIDPANSRLYSLEETSQGNSSKGTVDAFHINRQDGRLTLINRQVTDGGSFAHLSLDRTSRFLAAARYNDGNAVILPLSTDGQVQPISSLIVHQGSGPSTPRQDKAHVHSVIFDLANRFAFVADLGTDEISIYHFDATAGKLSPNTPASVRVPPGSGPRHFAFHPSGKFAYAVCELTATVISYTYDAGRGALTQTQVTNLLPDTAVGERRAAEVVVDRAGKFLYVSNRGYDALVVYAVDPASGRLTLVQLEHDVPVYPRNFAIDPTGRWLICANQNSNSATVYAVDSQTGRLTRTAAQIGLPHPVCVRFLSLD